MSDTHRSTASSSSGATACSIPATASSRPRRSRSCIALRAPARGGDPRAHRGDGRSPRAAGDGQGHRRRARHEGHRRALPLHQQERPARHRGRARRRRARQGGAARPGRRLALRRQPASTTSSDRREAFNIMLSMPRGTDPLTVQRAAREFAQAELADHKYVMVLHDHQANPHVHISVRAESKHGKRLNPRKADLHRWRETFAEKLRGWGIEAEATRQATRGVARNYEPLWRVKAREEGRLHTSRPRFKAGANATTTAGAGDRGMESRCAGTGRIGRHRRPRAGAGDQPVRSRDAGHPRARASGTYARADKTHRPSALTPRTTDVRAWSGNASSCRTGKPCRAASGLQANTVALSNVSSLTPTVGFRPQRASFRTGYEADGRRAWCYVGSRLRLCENALIA